MNKKIIIGIDASRSIDSIQKTGVEFVSDELLKEIEKLRNLEIKGFDVVYYTPEKIDWLPIERQKILRWPFKFFWTQIRLSWEMLIHKPDIFFSPVHTLPFFTPKKTHKIIHDIAFKKTPELYSFKQKMLLNFDLHKAIKKCKKIFVPSEQVKQDILIYADIHVDKIIVIPHGYNRKNNKKIITNNKLKQILYIGRIEAKKNILNLIKAFEIFSQKNSDYKLILAGKIDEAYVNNNINLFNQENIKLLGYISEEKKYQLLQESSCLAFVPLEEGFGIPILEAFDFELPVICSDIGVLREVGEDACIFVNPDSVEEISASINNVILSEAKDLIQKAKKQLERFNWQKTAENYLQEILQ